MKKIYLFASLLTLSVAFCSCKKEKPEPGSSYEGVLINGVTWSEFNVDAPGTFTENAEDFGMMYQWGRKTAWSTEGEASGWVSTYDDGSTWTAANDPCPTGWRVPTKVELDALVNTVKVASMWTTKNGTYGRLFSDRTTDEEIFLPAVGVRTGEQGNRLYVNTNGYYPSSTPVEDPGSVAGMSFKETSDPATITVPRAGAHAVRCVRK